MTTSSAVAPSLSQALADDAATSLPTGSTTPNTAPFKSLKEVTLAMKDKRYDVTNGSDYDPAYRTEVEQRLAASVKAGINLGITAIINGQTVKF
jgi:hypothetical protein